MDSRTDIIRLLSTLLSTSESVEKRKAILQDEFHIPMEKDIEEGMQDMCNLGEAVELYGVEKGMLTGQLKLIMSAMNKNGWDAETAMDILDVDMKDRPIFAERMREEQAKKS